MARVCRPKRTSRQRPLRLCPCTHGPDRATPLRRRDQPALARDRSRLLSPLPVVPSTHVRCWQRFALASPLGARAGVARAQGLAKLCERLRLGRGSSGALAVASCRCTSPSQSQGDCTSPRKCVKRRSCLSDRLALKRAARSSSRRRAHGRGSESGGQAASRENPRLREGAGEGARRTGTRDPGASKIPSPRRSTGTSVCGSLPPLAGLVIVRRCGSQG